MDMYCSKGSQKIRKIVIVFTDVYGMRSGNHQTFADTLQLALGEDVGVLVPDTFRGCPPMQPFLFLPDRLGSMIGVWGMLWRMRGYTRESMIEGTLMKQVIPHVKELYGADVELGGVGFCMGGWVVGQLAREPKLFKWGVGIHPSFNFEMMHGGTEVGLAAKIVEPVLLLPAGNDSAAMKVGGAAIQALSKQLGVPEQEVSKEYAGMTHGWVSRGDSNVDLIREQQKSAVDDIVRFAGKHFT